MNKPLTLFLSLSILFMLLPCKKEIDRAVPTPGTTTDTTTV